MFGAHALNSMHDLVSAKLYCVVVCELEYIQSKIKNNYMYINIYVYK